MSKKIISLFTMVAFVIFSLSCSTTKNVRLDAVDAKENGKIKILQMDTKSGETIEFSKGQPGRIYKESIIGTAVRVTERIEVDRANVERAEKEKDGKFLRIVTKDGKIYQDFVGAVTEEKDKYVFTATYETSQSVSIPLSEVEMIRIREKSPGRTLLVVVSVIGIPLLLLYVSYKALFLY